MAEKINKFEVSIGQLKDSKEKVMRDVVKEKERLQEEVTKAMHKVRVAINFRVSVNFWFGTKIIQSNGHKIGCN